MKLPLVFSLMGMAFSGYSQAASLTERGPEPHLMEFNRAKAFESIGSLFFENKDGGSIRLELKGQKPRVVGKVLTRAVTLSRNGYTASSWAIPGTVAATAVNAIHLKVTNDKTTGKGVIFSILPKEFALPQANYQSFLSTNSSIITDIPAGTGLFGDGFAPVIGSPIFLRRGKGEFSALTKDFEPKEKDELRIDLIRLKKKIWAMEFENRFGGLVYLDLEGGERRVAAQVLRPVQGVGRFTGTLWNRLGRIRANHTGVIDISTSPMGLVGGFQIIPDNHAMSEEMLNARLLTQWMVIGPLHAESPSLEGVGPFFNGLFLPSDIPAEPTDKDYGKKLLSRTIVQARLKGQKDYGPMVEAVERVDDALKEIEAIRILFPVEE